MLADALSRYKAVLRKNGFIEAGEVAVLLANDPAVDVELVVANRFADLSRAQEQLLMAFSQKCDVRVALPWEKGFPATEALDALVERISARATHIVVESATADSELGLLEARLYRSDAGTIAAQGQLVMAEASGEEAEQSLVADLVAEAVAEGIQPGRVAVVFRNAARRARGLSLQLAQRGVDVDVDVATPFQSAGLGRAFLTLLDVCSGREVTRERVLDLLQSPYSGIDDCTLSGLDTAWRQKRTEGRQLVTDVIRSGGPAAAILERGQKLLRGPITREKAAAVQWIAGALLAEAQRSGENSGDRMLDAAAHRAIVSTMSDLLGAGTPSHDPGTLSDALKRRKIVSGQADRADAVQITEVERIRSRRFDVVVLGGLTADEFSSDQAADPLSARVEELGISEDRDGYLAERLLFYLVVSRARNRLVLVRQTAGSEGEAKRASVFWDEVRELYGEAPEDPESPYLIPRRFRPLADIAVSAPAFSVSRQDVRSSSQQSYPNAETLVDDDVRSALAKKTEFSVTELETYHACPRRWFYERTISPRELDSSFDSRASGSLAHRILADFYEQWRGEAGHKRVEPDTLGEALNLMDRLLSRAEPVKTRGLREQLATAELGEWVRNIVRIDSRLMPDFEPVAHEYGFGETEERPVEIGSDTFIRGRIDRIDRRGTEAVVTDYKSRTVKGWKSFTPSGLIQIPLYAYVVAQIPDTDVIAGIYRSLADGTLRGFWDEGRLDLCAQGSDRDKVPQSDIQQLIDTARSTACEAADGIRAGEIPARPRVSSACQYCALAQTCGGAR